MKQNKKIYVTSHVSRDFLQNAVYFNTLPKVIWEYVSNALDNSKDDIPLGVDVEITSANITITDNGLGMTREDLSNFFTMHGVNIQRKKGKRVRGRFGTGKCAAFGIANLLRIDTVKNGLRNIVELNKNDIEAAKEGEPFPVCDIVINKESNLEDGTTIEISDIKSRVIDQINSTISYIERHLARYKRPTVTINGHICEFSEPPSTYTKKVYPPKTISELLDGVELIIKISPVPLEKDLRGVDILSNGIWHETTLAGMENKEFSSYIFGEVDVPIFEDREDWDIPPFDNTRNNTLNRQNPYVVSLLGWIAKEIEIERKRLVDKDKKRKESEEAKKLKYEAEKIAKILNEDFEKLIDDYELAKKLTAKRGKTRISSDPSTLVALIPGEGNEDTDMQKAGQPHGNGKKGTNPPGEGDEQRDGPSLIPGKEKGSRGSIGKEGKRRAKGIFSIEYLHETAEAFRSRYEPETRIIVINLDHQQIFTIYQENNQNVEARNFREISYEIAIVEYALAIPYERINLDEFYDAADALLDTRDTINRLSKRIAEVMS